MSSMKTKYSSTIDEEEEYIMGIDEAGRGPVLGSMVYGACICPLSRKNDLKKCGFNDSKQVKESDRERLFENEILNNDWIHWLVDVIPPDWLSSQMFEKNKYSLNEMSHNSAMNLIRYAKNILKFNIKYVYLDTVGIAESYEQRLNNHFMGYNIKFIVKAKADALYPIVSAASIVAKVTRDRVLSNWVFREKNLSFNNKNDKMITKSQSNEIENENENDNDNNSNTNDNSKDKNDKNDKIDKNIFENNNNNNNNNSDTIESSKSGSVNELSSDDSNTSNTSNESEQEDSDLDIDVREKTKTKTKANTKSESRKENNNNNKIEKKTSNMDFLGNGYPSDPLTKEWLANNVDKIFGFPCIVRFSWQTAKTIISKECANVKWSDEIANNSLAQFGFGIGKHAKSKRSYFYKKRNLQLCTANDICPF